MSKKRAGKDKKRKFAEADSINDSFTDVKISIESLESEIFSLKVCPEKQSVDISTLKRENDLLKESALVKQQQCDMLLNSTNELEQYTRRNSIRIFGIVDNDKHENNFKTEQAVIRFLKNKMNIEVSPVQIDICHRMGRYREGSYRPIIVKFVSRKTKIHIMANKRKLKGTNMFIVEDLTAINQQRVRRLRELQCVQQVWTRDGKIYAKNSTDRIMEVFLSTSIDEHLFETSAHRLPRNYVNIIQTEKQPPSPTIQQNSHPRTSASTQSDPPVKSPTKKQQPTASTPRFNKSQISNQPAPTPARMPTATPTPTPKTSTPHSPRSRSHELDKVMNISTSDTSFEHQRIDVDMPCDEPRTQSEATNATKPPDPENESACG